MNRNLKILLSAALGVVLLAAAPVKALAQEGDVGGRIIPSLELEQADVRDALKILFRNVGVSYTIAPDVQGTVTVSLKNVPFSTALQNVLNQVNATYRVEGGIYSIILRETIAPTTQPQDLPGTTRSNEVIRRIPIRHADPFLVMTLLSGNQSTVLEPETTTVTKTGSG
ncbi:MAG TPA: hypothetical protein VM754_05245, partial [Actinomycetota bacterium]|nr:hypothetical protein [Actinomycetota bacterium]